MTKHSILVLGLLLVAGCSQPGDHHPAQGSSPSEGDPSDVARPPAEGAPGGDPPASMGPPEPLQTTSWFPHVQPRSASPVSGNPTCGEVDYSLDRTDTPRECQGHGRRKVITDVVLEEACPGLCFPATAPMPPYPAGTRVNGSIFLTSDAADRATLTMSLLVDGRPVGETTVSEVIVLGLGGAAFQEVPFDFSIEAPLSGEVVEFVLQVDAAESWFVGFDDPATSWFTLEPPAP